MAYGHRDGVVIALRTMIFCIPLLLLLLTPVLSASISIAADGNDTHIVVARPPPRLRRDNLARFKETLEAFARSRSDVVFILDESGSIGVDRFPHAVKFAELVTRLFSVTADQTRVALITFSTHSTVHFNYVRDHEGNNMCTLIKDLDIIGFSGGWTRTRDALARAEKVLQHARADANK
ncbi:PREDICTED: sushi, von Willebrand factor type A, EGF and pentraxin domain-containing protein 1-like [Priapulus caudatus]|uniref:Sushi, von Willebrand factor type A, EGF and pentraxin domain-containing protein 1-like n=1 Tax=Priapulus caudatus TaxID=37621 RepID=A0ABM1EGI3_PRICU|nr:PREDICTED: sushi, von Willebrand factor type A, EGF and pentraxin domain-containing protein 1-like [Priapulus caudatus]